MRIILLCLLVIGTAWVLQSCTPTTPSSQSGYVTRMRYNYVFSMQKPIESKEMLYSDSILSIGFKVLEKDVAFSLQNLTNDALKIKWDEASFVFFGKAQKVIHTGTKFIEKSSTQVPTIIPPMASVDDLAAPSEKISYSAGIPGNMFAPGGWVQTELFPTYNAARKDKDDLIKSHRGNTFSLYLPIIKGEKQVNYNFVFKVDDILPIKK